jgi:adenosylhomocysteine nucleosidase
VRSNEAPLAIVAAMVPELALFEAELEDRQDRTVLGVVLSHGLLRGTPVVLAHIGVGKVNAALAMALLLAHAAPAAVICCGVAGGVHSDLRPGDVVVGAEVAQYDYGYLSRQGFEVRATLSLYTRERNPLFLPADLALLGLAARAAQRVVLADVIPSAFARGPLVRQGVIVTGDTLAAYAAKKAELREQLRADACEMEGAAVAQVCYQRAVPFLVVRGISDTSESVEQDWATYIAVAAQNAALLTAEIAALYGLD